MSAASTHESYFNLQPEGLQCNALNILLMEPPPIISKHRKHFINYFYTYSLCVEVNQLVLKYCF